LVELLDAGVTPVRVTLHVGLGTFRPIRGSKLDEHVMHREWCEVDAVAAGRIAATRRAGGRVVAVGTTSVRTLEATARQGAWGPWSGETDLFLKPGDRFDVVDAMLTNFHLPRSTLIVLVAAFAGLELTRRAYAAAVTERYRFYSYGDAMLIL
jgi:S-adenosylmethionine:tRNA ribosyltransferase-isomerase